MKFLLITSALPYPLDQGSRIRNFRLLEQLTSHGEVFLFCLCHNNPKDSDIEFVKSKFPRLHCLICKRSAWQKAIDVIKSIIFPVPYIVLANTNKDLTKLIVETIDKEKIDVLQIQELCMAENVLCEESIKCKVVLDAHNAEAIVYSRIVGLAANPIVKLFRFIQSRKMVRYERTVGEKVDAVFGVSPNDVVYFSEFSRHTRFVPNSVAAITKTEKISPASTLLFTGSLQYQPNADGLSWFLRQIWPLIRAKLPNTSFEVVARNPPRSLTELTSDGVSFLSDVDNIEPIFHRSGAMVVPVRAGGGTRYKILEGLAAGLPIVSTTLGAEGLRVIDGVHLYLRDEEQSFADAVISLLEDHEQRQRFADAGAELIQQWYLWQRAFPVCLETYERILQ